MSHLCESKFETRGEFVGFIRDESGKRRMLLRTGEQEELCFKLPGELRKRFADLLLPGRVVVVSGVEQHNKVGGWIRRVISKLEFLGAPEPAANAHRPIRVCAKKNCWKQGGKELWQTLEQKLETAGLTDVIKLKAVGCLDHCKRAPNLACGHTHLERCTPEMVDKLIRQLAAERS